MTGPHLNYKDRKSLIRYSLNLLGFTSLAIIIGFLYLDVALANFFRLAAFEKIYYYSREITNIGYLIHYLLLALLSLIFTRYIYPKSHYLKQKISGQLIVNIHNWSIFSIKALLVAGFLLNLLKVVIGRQRPHVAPQFFNLNFDMFTLHPHWHSFPSGHAQVMFSVATLALLIWPKQKYFFLSLATLIALTRITIHQHFLSDIIAGAFIGHIITLWVYNLSPPKIDPE